MRRDQRCRQPIGLVAFAAAALSLGMSHAGDMLDPTGRFAIRWWTVDDGLPETPLTGLATAADGSLLVVSRTRVCRVAGGLIHTWPSTDTRQVHQLIGDFRGISQDDQGTIWILGASGVAERRSPAAVGHRWRIHRGPPHCNRIVETESGPPLFVGHGTLLASDGRRLVQSPTAPPEPGSPRWLTGCIDPASGELWLYGGLVYGGTALVARPPPHPGATVPLLEAAGSLAGSIVSMTADRDGPVALLPTDISLRRDGSWQTLPAAAAGQQPRSGGTLARAADGTIWISSHTSFLAWRDGHVETVIEGLPDFSVSTQRLLPRGDGGMWAACSGGLLTAWRTSVTVTPLFDCRAVFDCGDGRFVVGTTGRILAWRPADGPPTSTADVLATLPADAVPTAILADASGSIWVGTQDSFVYRIEAGQATRVTQVPGNWETRNIRCLVEDTTGGIWAGTANGLARYDAAQGGFVQLAEYGAAAGSARLEIIGLEAEADGSLLVASRGRGVDRLQPGDPPRLETVLTAAELPARRRAVFTRDSRGGLWVGGEAGVVRIMPEGHTTRITVAEGLASPSPVRQIEDDGHGRLWLAFQDGCVQGLTCDGLDALSSGRVTLVRGVVLGRLDGLGDGECLAAVARPVAAASPRSGDPFPVMLDTGLAWIDPATAKGTETNSANGLAVRAEPTHGGVRFAFTTATAAVSNPLLFQTRLAGVDATWTAPAPQTTRDLPHLPPGRHRFEVRLVDGETEQDFPVASIDIDVPIPWWQRPPVIVGLALGLMAAAAAGGREFARRRARLRIARLEQQRAMDRERARIARDIHDSLGAGLTRLAILSEVIRRDVGAAGSTGERLDAIYTGARALTRSVDEIVWAVNPGNDTLSQLVNYIAHDVQDAARAAGLAVRVRVPTDLLDGWPVPTQVRHHLCLAVRELVANVLKHAAARELRLGIDVAFDRLDVALADDGCGFDPRQTAAAGQDGLRNVAARMRELGGRLEIESAAGQGTRARLSVPLGQLAESRATNRSRHAV